MSGLLKLLVTLGALIGACLAITYVWTGIVPADAMKVAGTYGICAGLAVLVKLISYSPTARN